MSREKRPIFCVLLSFLFACVIHHKPRYYSFVTVNDDKGYARQIRQWQSDQFIEMTFSLAQKVLEEKKAKKEKSFSLEYLALQNAYNDIDDMEFVILMSNFVQYWASKNYTRDPNRDYWPTLSFVLKAEREDCDGFELLMYHSLRERVGPGKVFRAILSNDKSIEYHMVTIWFDREDDPILIDPIGVITDMPARLSKIYGWKVVVMFNDYNTYKPQEIFPDTSK